MTWGEIKKKINKELEDDAKIRMLEITNKCDDIYFLYMCKTEDYIISSVYKLTIKKD